MGFVYQQSDGASVVAALMELSSALLDELIADRGAGDWQTLMQDKVGITIKGQDIAGLTFARQLSGVQAGLAAVEAVFASRR